MIFKTHSRQLCKTLSMLLICAATLPLSSMSQAQTTSSNYPNKIIKVVVPQPPGGGFDFVGRLLADRLGKQMGQGFVVENKPGSGTLIGTDFVAKSAPDGYTLLTGSISNIALNPGLYRNLPYDSLKDFEALGLAVSYSYTLMARKDLPLSTLKDVMAYAKANPGKLTYASSGDGSPQHLAGLMFTNRTGVEMLHVPYKGGAPAITDLMGGVVDMAFSPLPEALPHIKAGKLHPVGILSDKRASTAPDIPTLKEGGVNNVVLSAWIGLLAPAKTPQPVIDKLNQSVKTMLHSPDMKAKLQEAGMESAVDEAKPLQQVISEEIKIHAELVKAAGLVPQ